MQTKRFLGNKSFKFVLGDRRKNRPLFKYQGAREIFRCPADRGDIGGQRFVFMNATNCYQQYGTSYLIQWGGDFARTKRVFSDVYAPRDSNSPRLSIKNKG